METCVRGFCNSFMPETEVGGLDLQYIEGGELERTWKSTRRQRLKEQEDKIWDNFIKDQDILESVCSDNPYQFLEELPDSYLKELMNTELQKMRIEHAEENKEQEQGQAEGPTEEQLQHTVTFAEANYNEGSSIFQVYDDDKAEADDVSGPEDEGLNDSLDTARTVREREDDPRDLTPPPEPQPAAGEGAKSPERSFDKSSSKSSVNVSNLIESSIYCAKVKDLTIKINEEMFAIMSWLDNQHVASVEPQQLRNMCKRSAEFCGRFQRIHMYQLQRQIRDIKRHNSLALPFAKHTQFQSQMARVVSLHQNILQSFQVFHKSFSLTLCLRESGAALQALCHVVRDACACCRGCCALHLRAARDLFTEELCLTCDKLDETVNDYVAKVTDFVNATEASASCTMSKKSSKRKDKKKAMLAKNASKTDPGARLSMYSLATVHMGSSKPCNASSGTSKRNMMKSKKQDKNDPPKSHRKSPRSRRPLMRDPHAGLERRLQPPRDQEIRTMVEAVEAPSSHISREASPHVRVAQQATGTPRRRGGGAGGGGGGTPHTPHTSKYKETKTKTQSPHRSPPVKTRIKTVLSSIQSESRDPTVFEQFSPVSMIQCAKKEKIEENIEPEVNVVVVEKENCGTVTVVDEKEESRKMTPVEEKGTNSERKIDREKVKSPDLASCEVTRLLKQLCGGDVCGYRNERSSGAKNAQLLCINSGGSPRQPSTPQLLKILEETIQKKVPKSMYRKPKPKDADRLRLNFNIPEKTAENLFQYRTKFVQHMLTSSMYANSAVGKPWEMISSVSEQIIDDLLLASAKEMEIKNILKELYGTETS